MCCNFRSLNSNSSMKAVARKPGPGALSGFCTMALLWYYRKKVILKIFK